MRTILLLAALTALGSMAVHMFVPAMPIAASMLGAQAAEIQLALTVYLTGAATGQIAAGPFADAFGRRAVLLLGAALFVAGSAACWAAGSVDLLIAGRLVQSLGASASIVAGRAMIGDAGDARGARDMALLTALVMISPMLAPVAGSLLTDLAGWRSIFAVLTVAGALCGLGIALGMPDTPARTAAPLAGLGRAWLAILGNRAFLRNLGCATAMIAGLYLFLTASPFLMVETYHADPHSLGFYYGVVAVGGCAGALAASRLATRFSGARIMLIGSLITCAAGLVLLGGGLLGLHHIALLVAPMTAFTFGGGLVSPNAMMGAIAATPGRVGTAVSLYGALQMGGSAAASLLIAALPSHDPLIPMTGIAALSALSLLLVLGGRVQA